jgi:hypothetical protein
MSLEIKDKDLELKYYFIVNAMNDPVCVFTFCFMNDEYILFKTMAICFN